MLHSAEVRWFIPTELPTPVLNWFKAGHSVESEGVRHDEYLIFPECDSVGVKFRDEKFEIKAILSTSRPLKLEHGIYGRMDQWTKCSVDAAALASLKQTLIGSERLIKVIKERFLRKFSMDTGILVEVSTHERPSVGCNVELTCIEVEIQPRFWFSIGFEAFGPLASTSWTLGLATRFFFDQNGVPPEAELSGHNSFSYPAWLAALF